jgi:hypothetical protein
MIHGKARGLYAVEAFAKAESALLEMVFQG